MLRKMQMKPKRDLDLSPRDLLTKQQRLLSKTNLEKNPLQLAGMVDLLELE